MNSGPKNYPVWIRALIVVTLIIFAINVVFFSVVVEKLIVAGQITKSDITSLIGSLFSTFIGAYLAFRFTVLRSKKERVDKEVTAGNLALSTLVEIWDRQTQFQRDILEQYRGRADAWINTAIGTPLDSMTISLNRNDLAFVLQTNPTVWQSVVMEERRYLLVSKFIDQRETLVLDQAWPRITAAGIGMGTQILEPQMEAILGPAIVKRLRTLTTAIFTQIDENITTSLRAFEDLRAVLLKIYPNQKFINLQVSPPNAPAPNN